MENLPPSQYCVIERCHQLLHMRDLIGAQLIVRRNQQIRNGWHELDYVLAICDVLIAAKTPLPNGSMDYYGMMRVTRLAPVVLEDFKKLMKLLDKKHNPFSLSQEAADYVLLAWSILSKPDKKAEYDLTISKLADKAANNARCHSRGQGSSKDKGKGKMGTFTTDYCLYCLSLHELMTDYKELCDSCWKRFLVMKSNPVPLQQRRGVRYTFPKDSSFIPKKPNVELVVISDEDDDESQEIMTMSRAAKLCKVNGRRVKLIPLKKKTRNVNNKTATA